MIDCRLYMQPELTPLCQHNIVWVVDLGDGPVTTGCVKCINLEEILDRVEVLMFQWFAAHNTEEDVFELSLFTLPGGPNPLLN